MKYQRIDTEQATPLFECSWEEDRHFRMNPRVLTTLLREQIPVIDFVQFEFTSVEPGRAESVLPLLPGVASDRSRGEKVTVIPGAGSPAPSSTTPVRAPPPSKSATVVCPGRTRTMA